MRAARVHRFGEPLQIDDVPEPTVGPDDVLLDIRHVGVNPLDVWLTQGTVAGGTQSLPFIPGSDGVGEVDGRLVVVRGGGLGTTRDGLYAERAAVPRSAIIPLPEGIDPRQAAGLGVPGATAWALVHRVAAIAPDDRVLVLGASGGVGSLAAQMAKTTGAVVWGQTSSPAKEGFVRELGVDRVVVASAEELATAAADLSPTVVIDGLGDGYTIASIAATAPFGRIVLYGTSAGERATFDLRGFYRTSIDLLTYSGTIEPQGRNLEALQEALGALARGELRVFIDEVLPLEQAAEAHRRILAREVRGKILLAP